MTLAQFIKDNTWVITLVSGGLVGALVTAAVSAARQRTELAFKMVEQYLSRQPQVAEVLGILQRPDDLQNVASRNKVVGLGDWYETLALYYRKGFVDARLLRKAGIVKEMRRFLDECKRANANGQLDRALKAWTELNAL
jgi:hypothetical protein